MHARMPSSRLRKTLLHGWEGASAALVISLFVLGCGGSQPSGEPNPDSPIRLSDIDVAAFDSNKFPTFLAHLYGLPLPGGKTIHAIESATIRNGGTAGVDALLTAELQGYSRAATKSVRVEAGASVKEFVDLTFDFQTLYSISAPVSANIAISVSNGGITQDAKTIPVTVLPKNTIFWQIPDSTGKLMNSKFLVAAFVTPHDKARSIDNLLRDAADESMFKAMIGYQYHGKVASDDDGAIDQIGAVFNALKKRGIAYVNVPQDFYANAQNVKFPSESLATRSANCIDGALVFASALESISMEPAIVVVPGHAFVAVRVYPGMDRWVPIETTMVSMGTVADAIATAGKSWEKYLASKELELYDIALLRKQGIKPAPL